LGATATGLENSLRRSINGQRPSLRPTTSSSIGSNLLRVLGTSSDGVAFANIDNGDDTKPVKGKKDKSHITCHKCRNKGHYANECRELGGVNMLLAGVKEGAFDDDVSASSFTFHAARTIHKGTSLYQRNGKLRDSWILLDNQSTVNISSNRKLLKNVRATDRVISIRLE
jgi:hypothetical protein